MLRDYQVEAIEAALTAIDQGLRRILIALPTGTGKTRVFSEIARRLLVEPGDIAFVVAHTGELLDQAMADVQRVAPDWLIDREQAAMRGGLRSNAIAGSMQTLRGSRLSEVLSRFRRRIRLLIIDEAHHAVAPSYRALVKAILAERPDSVAVGVTATTERGDGIGLRTVFDKLVYHLDLASAIARGYLVPPKGFRVTSDVSLDNVPTSGEDFNAAALARAIDVERRNRLVIAAYDQLVRGRRTIVFAASVQHARHLKTLFGRVGVDAVVVWGQMTGAAREGALDDFRTGRKTVLINVGVLLEGVDVPLAEAIVLARPTRSPALFMQAVGRGLRPLPEVAARLGELSTDEERCALIAASAKPLTYVIDVVDATLEHELVTLPTILGRGLPGVSFELPIELENEPTDPALLEELRSEQRAIQAAANQVLDGRDVQAQVQDVALYTVPELPVELGEECAIPWRRIATDRYRATLPAVAHAAPTSLELIVNRQDGAVEAVEVLAGKRSVVGIRSSLQGAARALEEWAAKRHGAAMRILLMPKGDTTLGQRRALKELGVPDDRVPLRSVDAARLIDQLRDEETAVREVPA